MYREARVAPEAGAGTDPGARSATIRRASIDSAATLTPVGSDGASVASATGLQVRGSPRDISAARAAARPLRGLGRSERSSAKLRRAALVELALGSTLRLLRSGDLYRGLGFVRLTDYVAGQLTLRRTLLCGRVATKATTAEWVRRTEEVTLRKLEDEVGFWELIREERPEVWELLFGGPAPEGIVLVPCRKPRLHASAPGVPTTTVIPNASNQDQPDLHASASAAQTVAGPPATRCHDESRLHASAPGESPSMRAAAV